MTRIVTYLNGRRTIPRFPTVLSYHDGKVVGFGEEVPPTEVPGVLPFTLTALPVSILVRIGKVLSGGPAQGHRVRIRRRNAANTRWSSAQSWIDIGRSRSYLFTDYSDRQLIEAGRRYQIKVMGYNVVGDGVESAYMEVIPLTNIPAVPTYKLEAHDQAIRLTLDKVSDPLNDPDYPVYSYSLEERNAADTAWVPDIGDIQSITSNPFGAAGTHRIISDTDTQLVIDILLFNPGSPHNLINDREYRVRVRSENVPTQSAWSAWMSATPMMDVMPAMRPGLPTFTFAALRYDYDSTGDEVSAVVSVVPKPNIDGIGVTRWLIRYRQSGTTTWQTQTVVAQPDLTTAYGFRIDEDDIGKTYEVQVASRNDTGDSAYTASQSIVVAQPLVPAPTFTITYNPFAINDPTFFTCDPTAPVNPVLPLTGYEIRYREVGTSAWTSIGHALDVLNIGYFVEPPDSFIGKLLEVQMRGENQYSGGVWSASQRLQLIGVPNRPDLFLTAQAGGFDARIVPPPSGDRATSQHLRYRKSGTTDWITSGSLEIRNLDGNTAYEVQAWTSNPAGESLRTTKSVTTLAEPARDTEYLITYGDNLITYGDNLVIYGE